MALIKNIIILAVLAGAAYLGYNLFFAAPSPELSMGAASNEGTLLASEFLIRLNEIDSISFSRDFFEDPRFRSFVSFSTAPDSVSAGRPNPFSQ